MNSYNKKVVGEKVRQARVLKKMTLKDLSEMTSIKLPTLSRIENGKRDVTFNEIIAISKSTKKPISFFFENEGNHKEDENYKILEYFIPENYDK